MIRHLIVSGMSGSGKSTLISMLIKKYPDVFQLSVSYTTRNKRDNETDGVHYHFITNENFSKMIQENQFIEYTLYNQNYYGTPFLEKSSKVIIYDVDRKGIRNLKRKLEGKFVFIYCKKDEIRRRIIERYGRALTNYEKEDVERRIAYYDNDIKYFKDGNYDIGIENDNLESAFKVFEEFVLKEIIKK
ncbi:Guanylate kinase [Astathelohania contejeani]|uniref:Guanylate kinase n=1 Tax=Astathelohania contejeani TaxID=164912 RepID=A0ABQ7I0L4_9MICR|nr:Guanylate kinase [Thelohania contejeani]